MLKCKANLLFVWGIFLFSFYGMFAQKAIHLKHLTTADGLNFRHVNAIAQDKEGFMWFGTIQGITKHDGNTFINFDSSKGNPNFIPLESIKKFQYQKSSNTLWYIANQKLFALQLDSEKLIPLDDPPNVLIYETIDIKLDLNDHLWIVTDEITSDKQKIQHLYKYNGTDFQLIKSLERKSAGFTSIDITPSNDICWTTVSNEAFLFNQEGKVIKKAFLETYDWYGNTIHFGKSFFDSKNKHYYFPQGSGGIAVYEDFSISHALFANKEKFFYALEDHHNGIWFAGKQELYYLDASGEMTNYTEDINEALDFSHINTLFYDASQLLWLGTDNGLLKVKLKPQKFEQLLHHKESSWGLSFRGIFPLKNNRVATLCESENMLYSITPDGKAKALQFKNAKEALKDARYFISDTLTNKAYTVNNSLIEIDFETESFHVYDKFKPYLNETKSNPLTKLADGWILAGYKLSKLIRIDPKTKAFHPLLTALPEQDYEVRSLLQSTLNPAIIWVGTENNGLLKINLNGSIEALYNINSELSINKNSITTLLEVDELLFIGTFGGGITVLNTVDNSTRVIDKTQGLSDNNVAAILPASPDELLIATFNGLSTYHIKTNKYYNYFTEDGLTHNEFNFTSYYQDPKGNFYLGGMNGINKFRFEDLTEEFYLPELNFTKLEYYNQNKETLFQQTKLSGKPIVLSPYDINLTVDWSIPDYFNNENYRYYTQLEGFENQWTYQDDAHSIRYNKLPAGNYTLHIKGADINGNLSKAALEIPIVVKEIFYKRWWFIAMLAVFIMGLLYAFYRYRLQQAVAIERLRTKISSDLHDDVGSMLTGLAMQTEMLEMQTDNQIDKNRLHKITTLSRTTISHMRDLVWSIDGRKDTLGDLVERMQELAEEMLLPANISYHIQAEELNFNKKINLNCKRNLFLIYKEAINNIVKHSNANHAQILFTRKGSHCVFEIKDNGNVEGFKPGTGMGLANMKLRCKSIHAQLKFEVENGFGIKVELPYGV